MLRHVRWFAALLALFALACGGGPADAPAGPGEEESPDARASSSPNEREDGGPSPSGPDASAECAYDEVKGTITITAIEAPGPLEQACKNDGRHVAFSFAPDADGGEAEVPAQLAEIDEAVRRVTDTQGYAPAAECLSKLGIAVGATFRASRRLAIQGTCAPVIYATEIDFTACSCER